MKKIQVVIIVIYLLSSLYLLLKVNNFKSNLDQIRIINSNDFKERLQESITSDTNTKTIFITRKFHNKLLFIGEEFSLNITKSLDLPYLFGLSQSSMYDQSIKLRLLNPFEFPFFLIFVFYFIKGKIKYRDFLLSSILVSLFIIGFLEPHFNFIKFLPLIISLKIGIFLGLLNLLSNLKWLKN